jgi:hypothetical protein
MDTLKKDSDDADALTLLVIGGYDVIHFLFYFLHFIISLCDKSQSNLQY